MDNEAFTVPASTFTERPEDYELKIYLPGIGKSDADLRMEGRTLTLKTNAKHQNPAGFRQVAAEFELANYAMSVDLPEMADTATLLVNGDQLKLQQVIYNVIDNAIKYTPRGGEVHCSTAKSGKMAVIRIADTGEGIPAEDLPHIFDRFYRVDKARSRETGGTGLGLSIVKQIVMSHGGTITPESTLGKGTTFTIQLPIKKSEE